MGVSTAIFSNRYAEKRIFPAALRFVLLKMQAIFYIKNSPMRSMPFCSIGYKSIDERRFSFAIEIFSWVSRSIQSAHPSPINPVDFAQTQEHRD